MKATVVNDVRLTFPSVSSNEAFARAAAASFCAQLNPTYDELSDIKCAVSEAVTNAIVHGYRDALGEVQLHMTITDDRVFRAEIKDKGCGIPDVEEAMRPLFTTDPENERSGMGFTIIENFMDSLRVVSAPAKGTRVIMTKKLSMLPRVKG
ncbi:MAG: anti-sigma F factor [Clostridia bacterium]|nr:anti-sigma F factor [Oscillospiraceae bacterium]MBO4933073.1 anti-sigma F factor [Clostridia bacterium]MBO5127300.1 anti-sigma F factor [Clostridia bacterium]MBO5257781.1 anti-sigma F factor [Clostridia bacterium]MBP3294242.1 anti-sigma F factor [Clostridia bacterium]